MLDTCGVLCVEWTAFLTFTPKTCPAKPTPDEEFNEGITTKSPTPLLAGEVSSVRIPVLVIAPLEIVPTLMFGVPDNPAEVPVMLSLLVILVFNCV